MIFDGAYVIGHHQFATFVNLHLVRHRLVLLGIAKTNALDIVVSSIVVLLIKLLSCLLIKVLVAEATFGQCLCLRKLFIFYLFNLGNALRPVSIQLLLQQRLHLFLNLLLILLLLNFMLLL